MYLTEDIKGDRCYGDASVELSVSHSDAATDMEVSVDIS